MLERGLHGKELDEELRKAEEEAGVLGNEKPIKKETPPEERIYIGKPVEDVKTAEQIAIGQEKNDTEISNLKNKINETIDQANQDDATPESKFEKIGHIESIIKGKIDNLINSAQNEEDKKVFTEILDRVNKIKNNIREERKLFKNELHQDASLENMKKFYTKNNILPGSMNRGLDLDFMHGFDDKDADLTGTTIVDLNKVTKEQMGKILNAFDFWKIIRINSIPDKKFVFQAYNSNKRFWEKKAKQGDGKHNFMINSRTPGVILKAHGDETYGDFMRISLGKQFAEEIFKEEVK